MDPEINEKRKKEIGYSDGKAGAFDSDPGWKIREVSGQNIDDCITIQGG